MADHQRQRIHPVDLESQTKPTAPLVPQGATRSDKGDPTQHPYPPPLRRQYPASYLPPPKRRRGFSFCRCLCCTFCLLVLLVVIIAVALAALYFIFDPKLPKYSVDRFAITAFTVDSNLTAHASFDVTVTAQNPNKGIGIYYEKGSKLSVLYDNYDLTHGAFPVFYQGHKNSTVLNIVLSGEAQFGGDVMNSLQEQQKTGTIPLEFKGDVPVRIKLGALKIFKIVSTVRCDLVIDSLTVGSQIKLKSSNCKFGVKL
ncbi:hypothetical protein LUZ60_014840 [Juncus effusus]|nr:hypothetical protein LUZ60_014840 [Juncus effusus]